MTVASFELTVTSPELTSHLSSVDCQVSSVGSIVELGRVCAYRIIESPDLTVNRPALHASYTILDNNTIGPATHV